MTAHFFAYGSLMFPEVWQRVVRGRYPSTPACAHGFARYGVAGATYPGMIAQPGSTVRGVLYFDVDTPDIEALDRFEGREYRRETLQVAIDNGETLEAAAYLYLAGEKLTNAPWLPEAFEMERFIDGYCRVRLG